jgi:hypothetical protein
VTIIKGKSPFYDASAKRLTKILEPWGVRCRELDLAQASRTRPISDEEARTWVGLDFGRVKAGADNPPGHAGFAVQGPVILLGNPQDHPMIDYLSRQKFLPYATRAGDFPGVGRGLVAWQRDGVGRGQESITLIAYDEAGMTEAVGSCYEAVAGMDPLMPWVLPEEHAIAAANSAPGLAKAAPVVWAAAVSDRVLSLSAADGLLRAISHDGSLSTMDRSGKLLSAKPLSPGEFQEATERNAAPADPRAVEALKTQARSDRMAKLAVAAADRIAIAYWGGALRVVDAGGAVQSEQMLPQDITALAWLDDLLVAGLADGRVIGLGP